MTNVLATLKLLMTLTRVDFVETQWEKSKLASRENGGKVLATELLWSSDHYVRPLFEWEGLLCPCHGTKRNNYWLIHATTWVVLKYSNYVEWKNANVKSYIPYDSTNIMFWKWQNDRDGKYINGFEELGRNGERGGWVWVARGVLVMKLFSIWLWW